MAGEFLLKSRLWCVFFFTFLLILLIVVHYFVMFFFSFISNDEGFEYPFDFYNELNYGPYFCTWRMVAWMMSKYHDN